MNKRRMLFLMTLVFALNIVPVMAQTRTNKVNLFKKDNATEESVEADVSAIETSSQDTSKQTEESISSIEETAPANDASVSSGIDQNTSIEEELAPIATDANVIPKTITKLMNEKRQANKMLDIAWQDYQQIADYTFADVNDFQTAQVTTYDELIQSFKINHQNVEIIEEKKDEGIGALSITYKAEDGDLHPTRMIEDWARVEFYFLNNDLIYAGVSTMSFEFSKQNMVSKEEMMNKYNNTASIQDIANLEHFELNGLGQMLSGGKMHYAVAFPIHSKDSNDVIGEVASATIIDDKISDIYLLPAQSVIDFSYVGIVFVALTKTVENNIFQ